MKEIDGSEGGGQLLRTSLALAAIQDRDVRLTGIRGDRPEPGLKHQHLAAVNAIAAACNATVGGATLGSQTVEFEPGRPEGGHIEVDIRTAGSITLLFDAVFPLALSLEDPLAVTATGGTDVKWSPPTSTYTHTKLPLCRQFGLHAAVERHRTGFYPAGGGRATLSLAPSKLAPLELARRGSLRGAYVYSRESRDLADSNVAARQAGTARARLDAADIEVVEEVVATAETHSAGSALTVVLDYEETYAGFDALGEPGKPAEKVADEAIERALSFHDGDAVVDRHLADQLLVFLALAGGELAIPALTDHVTSSLDLLSVFGLDVSVDTTADSPILSAER